VEGESHVEEFPEGADNGPLRVFYTSLEAIVS